MTRTGPAASFRDPNGVLLSLDGRILRLVDEAGARDLAAFLTAASAKKFVDGGRVVATSILEESEIAALRSRPEFSTAAEAFSPALVAEHERIPFPSYPYEWPPEMLHAAGDLTVDLALALLDDGIGLKDATPYNILFRGPVPVFIDLLSFEQRDPHDPTWLPYAQFVRTFLLPLAANRYFGLSLDQVLATRRDGLEPDEVYRWTGPLQRLRPPFLSLVSMPKWLSSRHDQDDQSIYRKRSMANAEKARFVLESLLRGLKRNLRRVSPPSGRLSTWTGYMAGNNNYTPAQFEAKQTFIKKVLDDHRPKRVLDVGCNTGHFSALAARSGAGVVAIDYDPVVAGGVWRSAKEERLDILPLVVNLTRPSPGTGWRNAECLSFLDRARGAFDCVLMLALVHHMLVTERIPLREILGLASELTTDLAVIEFIGPQDSMFQRLVRGREHLHSGLSPEHFEAACRGRFEVLGRHHMEGTHRWLYLLRKAA